MRRPKQLLIDTKERLSEVQEQPSVLLTWTKRSLIRTWQLRGGGFYGLGFLAVFLVLQAQDFASDVAEAESAMGFVGSQITDALLKFANATFANMISAFVWPVLFVNWLGSWGIPVLIAGFLGFDRWAKPYINKRIPELAKTSK